MSSPGVLLYDITAQDQLVPEPGQPGEDIQAGDVPTSADMCGGLGAHVKLAVGARVMLRRNVHTLDGLVNGAQGSVTGFEFSQGAVSAVLVQFDDPDVGRLERARAAAVRRQPEPASAPVAIARATSRFYSRWRSAGRLPSTRRRACRCRRPSSTWASPSSTTARPTSHSAACARLQAWHCPASPAPAWRRSAHKSVPSTSGCAPSLPSSGRSRPQQTRRRRRRSRPLLPPSPPPTKLVLLITRRALVRWQRRQGVQGCARWRRRCGSGRWRWDGGGSGGGCCGWRGCGGYCRGACSGSAHRDQHPALHLPDAPSSGTTATGGRGSCLGARARAPNQCTGRSPRGGCCGRG